MLTRPAEMDEWLRNPQATSMYWRATITSGLRPVHTGGYERVRAAAGRPQLATPGVLDSSCGPSWMGDVVARGHTARSERCPCLP